MPRFPCDAGLSRSRGRARVRALSLSNSPLGRDAGADASLVPLPLSRSQGTRGRSTNSLRRFSRRSVSWPKRPWRKRLPRPRPRRRAQRVVCQLQWRRRRRPPGSPSTLPRPKQRQLRSPRQLPPRLRILLLCLRRTAASPALRASHRSRPPRTDGWPSIPPHPRSRRPQRHRPPRQPPHRSRKALRSRQRTLSPIRTIGWPLTRLPKRLRQRGRLGPPPLWRP